MTDEYLKQLEAVTLTDLPETYRWFLNAHSLSAASAIYPAIDNKEFPEGGMIETFYGASSTSTYDSISNYKTYYGRIHPDLLPIGDAGFGNQVCLGILGDARGKFYFWDHEGETIPGGPMPTNNTFLIANSFEEFVMSLKFKE